jgi:hypothetical protein
VVAVAPLICGQFVAVLVSQRSHIRPVVVPVGPVYAPLLTVSFWPTTALPVIVPAEVTSTDAA